MKQVKTSELSGAALDWAVAIKEGVLGAVTQAINWAELCKQRGGLALTHGRVYSPSTNWAQGGPIIERERISTISDFHELVENWLAESCTDNIQQFGPTPLIAAMRCFVAFKLGDVVSIPEEL